MKLVSTQSVLAVSAAYARTLMINSAQVTRGVVTARPPNTDCACRTPLLPSAAHSGHWKPTEASRMQSGQMGRSQRWQRT
ncbi:hypothetical protein [Streptosporangium vulgare]|uniref:hypothetical protein n=1 Tax=Streptosporangium vulgare TaxID=46190 RepID=UPI0031D9A6DA